MDEQRVLIEVMLPELQDEETATLYNDVSRVLYRTYDKPMGAALAAVITYVIKELQKEGKVNYGRQDIHCVLPLKAEERTKKRRTSDQIRNGRQSNPDV